MSRSAEPGLTRCLSRYVRAFQSLHTARRRDGIPAPHKPAMLLAVIEAVEAGAISDNRILFSPSLLERFRNIFGAVRHDGDRCKPELPFWHLQTDRFWHLEPTPGCEQTLAAIPRANCPPIFQLNDLVAHAYLDAELFEILQQPEPRGVLRQAILTKYFPGGAGQTLATVISVEQQTATYERFIQARVNGELVAAEPAASAPVRDAAFRRTVAEAYDYRCAATGLRIILPDGAALVEAAHLIPWSESHDDDPRNGMALSPTYHDLLDSNMIAPGPDLKWHVSRLLDPRIPDFRDICDLQGRAVLLPRDTRYYPRKDALEWRVGKLA